MKGRYRIQNRTLYFKEHSKLFALIFFEILSGLTASILAFILFLWLTEGVLFHEVNFFDRTVTQYIQSFRAPWLTLIMYVFTFFGSYALVIGSIVVVGVLLWKHKQAEMLYFVFILAISLLINLGVKQLIARPRPPHPMYHEIFYSFPSEHAMGSFVFYAIVVFGIFHFTRKKRLSILLGIIMLVFVCLIGLSRIYLGVHYPSDVVGGFIAGFWWVVMVLIIEKTYILARLWKENH